MKRIEVRSIEPLDSGKLDKIAAIFREAECPNEALRNTFAGYVDFDGETLHLGSKSGYYSNTVYVEDGKHDS